VLFREIFRTRCFRHAISRPNILVVFYSGLFDKLLFLFYVYTYNLCVHVMVRAAHISHHRVWSLSLATAEWSGAAVTCLLCLLCLCGCLYIIIIKSPTSLFYKNEIHLPETQRERPFTITYCKLKRKKSIINYIRI